MGRTGIGLVCLCLWTVVVVVRGQDVNVAPGKTYSQSSKYSVQDPSDRAANEDTSGKYSANCIHTDDNGDLNPWWEVDLGKTYPVNNISIWARTDFRTRLYPSTIIVGGETCTTVTNFSNDTREKEVTCSAVMYGQTVRITRHGTGQESLADRTLNLCEMEIWVPSEVSQCPAGRYGTSCDLNCSDHCGKGPGKNFCYQSSGYCYDGCVAGWYGDQCSTACSPGCQNNQCDRQTGDCAPCNTGYTGNMCTECQNGYYKTNTKTCDRCSSNCQLQSCNSQTGKCDGCVEGYFGVKCDMTCTTPNCHQCHQDSDQCEECTLNSHLLPPPCTECETGFYKPNTGTCNRCSPNCKNQSCDSRTGRCNDCVDGYYGDMCDMNCPAPNCHRCHQDTEQCEECTLNSHLLPPNCTECENRYYKTNTGACDVCSSKCQSQSCDSQTGGCNGCVDGYHGAKCDMTCPTSNCHRCHQNTGQCEECTLNSHLLPPPCTGCEDSYYGDMCDMTCPTPNCQRCHQVTGECGECALNLQLPTCTDAEDDDIIPVIVGAVVAVIAVIIIVVVIVCVVMRKRKHAAKSSALGSKATTKTQTGGERREPEHAGPSPLSFAPVIVSGDKKDARPKPQVKPAPKPTVKPKPTRTDIYVNVPNPQQNPDPNSTPTQTAQSPQQNGTANDVHKPMSELMTDDEELDSQWSGEEAIYSNDPSYSNSIRVDQLQKVIVDSLHHGKVADEFQFMAGLRAYPLTNGRRQENYHKNRFKSIVPYDRNRVVLEQLGDDDASDYINASYVKGYKTEKAYIAAQGPRSNTQDDFWRMVWQEGVTDIVMLTNLKEGNKPKCHEYWPAKGKSLNTGHMEVDGLEEEMRAHFVIRTFTVRKLQGNDKRQVRQYHYVKWMDHEVPATTPLVNFWRYVRARAPQADTAPPLLVHCSAGVGRTGTYIALDILIDQVQKQEEISLYQTVNNLRNCRCHMVQSKSQYEFLHEAVLEAYMSGDSRLDTSSFDSIFPNTIQHHHPHPRIDGEFQRLCQMRTCLIHPLHTVANLDENRQKNRNPDALPDDKHLVYIPQHAEGRNQYINAVLMTSFLSSRGSIVTQLPLADTVTDLWRLVDSWDVSTIVSIGQEDGAKGTCQYWPKAKEQPIKTDPYTIRLKSMTSLQENLDSYLVDMKKAEDTSQEIRVLHYKAWTGEVADNVSDLIHLLDILHTSQKESTQQPIIIQCIDGVTKSGAVCALWDAISRLAYDGDVDVYLAVRHVHTVRPEAITSVIQYRFLYEVVQAYRASHLVYANT